jgi:hypothetical protein
VGELKLASTLSSALIGPFCVSDGGQTLPAARNSYVIVGARGIYNYVTTVELVNCEYISKSRLKDMMGDSSEVLAATAPP